MQHFDNTTLFINTNLYPIKSRYIEPFFTAGIGPSYNRIFDMTVPGSVTAIVRGKNSMAFGYQFGIGAVIPLNPNIHVAFSLKRLSRGSGHSKGIMDTSSNRTSAITSMVPMKYKFRETQIMFSLKVNSNSGVKVAK